MKETQLIGQCHLKNLLRLSRDLFHVPGIAKRLDISSCRRHQTASQKVKVTAAVVVTATAVPMKGYRIQWYSEDVRELFSSPGSTWSADHTLNSGEIMKAVHK